MTKPRVGARRMSEIPPAVLRALENGEYATANLVEWLAVDQLKLCKNVLKKLGFSEFFPAVESASKKQKKPTAMKSVILVGNALASAGVKISSTGLYAKLAEYPSDIVRSWVCYIIHGHLSLSLKERLKHIQPFAADPHFGVREVAWMAVREPIAADLKTAVPLLAKYAQDKDANIRRFASEVTRPCGVWCAHIPELKQKPEICVPILQPLLSDSSKYVRDSVANWLNDAGKTQPDFVKSICEVWQFVSPTEETAYIVKRALRNLGGSTKPKVAPAKPTKKAPANKSAALTKQAAKKKGKP